MMARQPMATDRTPASGTGRPPALAGPRAPRPGPPDSARVARFAASMAMDLDRWRDGTGYDLDAIADASEAERAAMARLVRAHQPRDWRDVEALCALDGPQSRAALRQAARGADLPAGLAVLRHAPGLLDDAARARLLARALRTAEFYGGLTQALDQAAAFHPKAVVDALWYGVRRRDGAVAVHCAALLMFIHGLAAEPFDWSLRPYFLRFHTADLRERRVLLRALRQRIVNAAAQRPAI